MTKEAWLKEKEKCTNKLEFELLKRATDTLEKNIARGKDLPWSPYRCIVPGKNFPGIWNWDSAFHAMGVSEWDAGLAKECILGFMQFQKEDGMLPDVIWTDGRREERLSKPPVMPYAAEIVYKRCNDTNFIKKLYPQFVRNEEFWRKKRKSGGLFFYDAEEDKSSPEYETLCGYESGWDNSVRWDFAGVSELWAIDLNCYMVMFYRSMAFFAEELGYCEDISVWRKKENDLKTLIEEHLWNEEINAYVDVNRHTRKKSGVLTPASFMPLFVGTASEKRAEAMNRLANDKNKFAFAMPTVSYDNAEFSRDYWRGPTWLNVAYFAAKGLKNYGFDAGDKIKNAILTMCSEEKRGIFENYDSPTGTGLCCDGFGWSAVFVTEFILNF